MNEEINLCMILQFPEYMFGYLISESAVQTYYSDIITVMADCGPLETSRSVTSHKTKELCIYWSHSQIVGCSLLRTNI